MSNRPPSDPDHINTKALEGMMGAFDHVVRGQFDLAEPKSTGKMVCKASGPRPRQPRASFWYTFPPLMVIRYIRDTIRLRKYNRDWSKNNPPMTIAEAISRVDAVTNQRTQR